MKYKIRIMIICIIMMIGCIYYIMHQPMTMQEESGAINLRWDEEPEVKHGDGNAIYINQSGEGNMFQGNWKILEND